MLICKIYVTKSESTEYFNIHKADVFKKHILVKCLGSIKLIILLLGYSIYQLLIAIEFFSSISFEVRNKITIFTIIRRIIISILK